jgi:hypothetical protein
MNNVEYIKDWIRDIAKNFNASSFKYVFFDDDLHIIKYSDNLQKNVMFLEYITNLIIDFSNKFDEEIIIIPESDNFFKIDCFDFIYGEKLYEKSYINSVIINELNTKYLPVLDF